MTNLRRAPLLVVLLSAACTTWLPSKLPSYLDDQPPPDLESGGLPTTFGHVAHEGDPTGLSTAFERMVGRWVTPAADLVIARRLERAGLYEPEGSLFGAIKEGEYEGVFSLTGTPEQLESSSQSISMTGRFYRADDSLAVHRVRTVLDLATMTLSLEISETSGPTRLDFERVSEINEELLARVRIIGHRGLYFDDERALQNREIAFRSSWLFGASGVELDVTSSDALSSEPRVYHPPNARVVFEKDTASEDEMKGYLDLPTALKVLRENHIPFVYVDPKLVSLHRNQPDRVREVLDHIVSSARNDLEVAPSGRHILIGAEESGDGQTADRLRERALANAAEWRRLGLTWAPEYTGLTCSRTIEHRFWDLVTSREASSSSAPGMLSISLLRVHGSDSNTLFEWTLPDMSRREERFVESLDHAVILWTASGENAYRGALHAFKRMGVVDLSHPEERAAGIITSTPHRLAHFLATVEWHRVPAEREHELSPEHLTWPLLLPLAGAILQPACAAIRIF